MRKLKLGDFGLACYDSLDESPPVLKVFLFSLFSKTMLILILKEPSTSRIGHSRGVGTALYAAPEQVKSGDYGLTVRVSVFFCFKELHSGGYVQLWSGAD